MPLTMPTSGSQERQLHATTPTTICSAVQTEENCHKFSNGDQDTSTLNRPTKRNAYSLSVISMNSARAQRSIQDNLKPPPEITLDELNFTIGRCLGSGGQAKVHILVDQYAREFAGKVFVRPEDLKKEYENYTNIGTHPNIAQCYGKKEVNGKEYLVMEQIHGNVLSKFIENLDNYCRIVPKDVAQYAPALRLILIEQLMDALNFLGAKGINHADLKPDNILISEDGQLKLIDFGLSKTHQETPNGKGTLHYLAPETIIGHQTDYSKIDSYAAGNIALELLTGCYLRQKGSLSHHSEGHDGQMHAEIFAGGDNFINKIEPINAFPLSSSGSFFSTENKADIENKNAEEKPFHPNFHEAFGQPNHTAINQQLEAQVIRALLCIHPKDRADIKVVHQTVKKMVDEYLTQEVREQAISWLQKMNHSPIKDFMQNERNTVQSLIDQGLNYAHEKIAHAQDGMLHYPDSEDIAETSSKVLPNKHGIVWFNPDKKTCNVVMGAVSPYHRYSRKADVSGKPAQTSASKQSATVQSTSASTVAKGKMDEKQKPELEKERLQLEKLELDRQISQQQLDKLKLKKLQEQQQNKSLLRPATSSVANMQKASFKTQTANKKKTPLLAD